VLIFKKIYEHFLFYFKLLIIIVINLETGYKFKIDKIVDSKLLFIHLKNYFML